MAAAKQCACPAAEGAGLTSTRTTAPNLPGLRDSGFAGAAISAAHAGFPEDAFAAYLLEDAANLSFEQVPDADFDGTATLARL